MAEPTPPGVPVPLLRRPRLHYAAVTLLLVFTAVRAISSLVGDSVTFDEPFHLAAGVNAWRNGDYRISPDHPPLGRMWAILPLLFMDYRWPDANHKGWREADDAAFCVHWLFELNDAQRLVVPARCMMVALLLGVCLVTYALGRMLFGPEAGLLALVLACLSPTLLAHGRLVTTDMPVTFGIALSLLTCGWLLRRASWPRLIAAAVALAITTLTKYSWPLVLPALGVMILWALIGRRPLEVPSPADTAAADNPPRLLTRRRQRVGVLLGACAFIGLVVWAGIWAGYRWRPTLLAPPPDDADPNVEAAFEQTRQIMIALWQIAFCDKTGQPRTGWLPALLHWAADHHVLPEAYLFGIARTLFFTVERRAYLMGQYSDTGWRSYFPIAFLIKTPVPTQLLILAGLVALVLRRTRLRDAILLAGVSTFIVVYAGYVIQGTVNIGHRHLLPLYPPLLALAGASARWLTTRVGRGLIGVALAWLAVAHVRIHPHYLAYFNELVGGPANGYRYLADSNLDWGQDLLRLADYARKQPAEPIKLAYFGSAVPTHYLPCEALPSYFPFRPVAELTPGTYAVSATQLVGVYDPELRPTFWTPDACRAYAQLARIAAREPTPDDPPDVRIQRDQAAREYAELRAKRLIVRLRERPPDERVGYSLLLYRLTAADIAELTRP